MTTNTTDEKFTAVPSSTWIGYSSDTCECDMRCKHCGKLKGIDTTVIYC